MQIYEYCILSRTLWSLLLLRTLQNGPRLSPVINGGEWELFTESYDINEWRFKCMTNKGEVTTPQNKPHPFNRVFQYAFLCYGHLATSLLDDTKLIAAYAVRVINLQ